MSRRTRLTRLVAMAVLTALAVVVAGSQATAPAAAAPAVTVVRSASVEVGWTPDTALYVLLLGDDRRAGAGCGCSDAIHLVGIPPGGGQATMLNIPRDTRVAVPGHGTRKVNDALALGGPDLAAQTIGAFVGVPVHYTFVVSFDAFPALVDELGGVVVDVPTRIDDSSSGADLQPGPVAMDGLAAMAFSRARKGVEGGDFGRTTNQAILLISALEQLRTNGGTPADEIRYLGTLVRHVRADGISAAELYRLGRVALAIDPAAVRSVTLPAWVATISGTSYVVTGQEARDLFADFADDTVLQAH